MVIDTGFVHAGQPVKLKLAAYPFQKYGMIDGTVLQVSADANDTLDQTNITTDGRTGAEGQKTAGQPAYRTLVELKTQVLPTEFEQLKLTPGMQLAVEIKLRDQTVLEYLLSPVRKAFHEAARER